MRMKRAFVFMAVPILGGAVFAAAPTAAEGPGRALAHPLFDANHCLQTIRTSREEPAVEFHWGCAERPIITMSCIDDTRGYQGLGPRFARPGWHCNHPMPPLADVKEPGPRISDVGVGDTEGRALWAACFVSGYGTYAERDKPYHDAACYRAMLDIKKTVNDTKRHPAAVMRELLP